MTARGGHISGLLLRLCDLSLLVAALGLTIIMNYAPDEPPALPAYALDFLSTRITIANALLGGLLVLAWQIAFDVQSLYLSHRLSTLGQELREVARAVGVASLGLLLVAQAGRWQTINAGTTACFCALSFALVGGVRLGLRWNLRRLRARGRNTKTLLVVGTGPRAAQFAELISARADLGYQLLGFLDDDPNFAAPTSCGAGWAGRLEDLPGIVARQVVDEVLIALPIKSHYAQIEHAIAILEEQGIPVHLLTDLFRQKISRARATELDGTPLVSLSSGPPASWRMEVKRTLDVIASAVLLVLLAPLFAVVAVLVKLDSAGPVFFTHERMGYNKRRFRMIKFRTMAADAEARMKEVEHLNEKEGPIFKVRNDPRVTRVGRWLRRTSVDELPQLFNVLAGDMSLVGPRPLSMRDALGLEEAWQKRRFSVKPGLTCLWQVSGRSNLSFEQWMQLDLEYIDRWSLGLDFWILLRTVPAVISAEGAV